MTEEVQLYALDQLMSQARRLAAEYRRTVGRPLPVSGELACYDAARLLDLELTPAAAGWDAVGRGSREGLRYQIKARAIFDESRGDERVGQLRLDQPWDGVLLVLLDADFEPFEIWEADREALAEALEGGGESRRKQRGAMSVARFRIIGHPVWSREEGVIEDEIWEN